MNTISPDHDHPTKNSSTDENGDNASTPSTPHTPHPIQEEDVSESDGVVKTLEELQDAPVAPPDAQLGGDIIHTLEDLGRQLDEFPSSPARTPFDHRLAGHGYGGRFPRGIAARMSEQGLYPRARRLSEDDQVHQLAESLPQLYRMESQLQDMRNQLSMIIYRLRSIEEALYGNERGRPDTATSPSVGESNKDKEVVFPDLMELARELQQKYGAEARMLRSNREMLLDPNLRDPSMISDSRSVYMPYAFASELLKWTLELNYRLNSDVESTADLADDVRWWEADTTSLRDRLSDFDESARLAIQALMAVATFFSTDSQCKPMSMSRMLEKNAAEQGPDPRGLMAYELVTYWRRLIDAVQSARAKMEID